LSRAYARTGRDERADTIIREALERNPEDRPANHEAALRLLKGEDWQRHRDEIRQHLALSYMRNDKNHAARYLHARFLFLIGEQEEARILFAAISEAAPPVFHNGLPRQHDEVSRLIGSVRGYVRRMTAAYAFVHPQKHNVDVYASRALTDEDEWNCLQEGSAVLFGNCSTGGENGPAG
jgi:tetratricopeptide (TPR) repeat protein